MAFKTFQRARTRNSAPSIKFRVQKGSTSVMGVLNKGTRVAINSSEDIHILYDAETHRLAVEAADDRDVNSFRANSETGQFSATQLVYELKIPLDTPIPGEIDGNRVVFQLPRK